MQPAPRIGFHHSRADARRHERIRRHAATLLLVLIVHAGHLAVEDAARASDEIVYGPPRQIATLANDKINESSGLAVSRIETDLFWTHNDSGDKPRIYAFDAAGKDRGEFDISGAEAVDWEDMASVTLDGKPYLIIGDVGDNTRRRDSCSLYVIEEPTSRKASPMAQRIRFRYEDGPRDCEAVAIDPITRRIFLVTKSFALQCPIYQLAWPAQASDEILVARKSGSVRLPFVTAMDIGADGRRAILATYANAYEFHRRVNESWRDAFARTPRTIEMPERRQGESICYGHDSQTLYLTSEKTPTPLWRVAPQSSP